MAAGQTVNLVAKPRMVRIHRPAPICRRSSVVEQSLGKREIVGPTPTGGSHGVVLVSTAMVCIRITGMLPPYGTNIRTDEDYFACELQAA